MGARVATAHPVGSPVVSMKVPSVGCSTCPYRRDTPPGIWAPVEYEKLREYDEGGGQLIPFPDGSEHRMPAITTFHCHQENVTVEDTVCRGWLSVHADSVAVRLACSLGLDWRKVPTEPEPIYYATGAEAADAGLAGCDDPAPEAKKRVENLLARGTFGLKGCDE